MKINSSLILSFTLIGLWSCSDSGEPLIEGCTDSNACNYSIENTHDDGSCWNPLEGCSCADTNDCLGVCNGSAVTDNCGECDGDNSSCVNYSTEIQPIFDLKCTDCHGSAGGLTLDSYSTLMAGNVVEVGNSAGSLLVKKLKGEIEPQMPKGQDPLNEATINIIETWINEGALDN